MSVTPGMFLAEVTSDDEFEVGLNALLTGFRDLAERGTPPGNG